MIRTSELMANNDEKPQHSSNYFPQSQRIRKNMKMVRKRSQSLTQQGRNFLDRNNSQRRATEQEAAKREDRQVYKDEIDDALSDSLENDCVNSDCPFRQVKVLYDELKQEYSTKIQENHRLSKKINKVDLPSDRGSIRSKGENQDKVIDGLCHEISMMEFKVKGLENDLLYTKQMLENKKEEVCKKDKMIEELEGKRLDFGESNTYQDKSEIDKRITSLLKENDELQRLNTELSQEIEKNKGKGKKRFDEPQISEEFLLDLSIGNPSSDKQIKQLEAEIEKLKKELDKQLKSSQLGQKELLLCIEELKEENKELVQQNSVEQEDASKLKKAYESILAELKEIEETNTALKSQAKDAKHTSDTLEREKERLDSEIEQLNENIYKLNKEKSENESKACLFNDILIEIYSEASRSANREMTVEITNTGRDDFANRSVVFLGQQEARLVKEQVLEIIRNKTDPKSHNKSNQSSFYKPNIFEQEIKANQEKEGLKYMVMELCCLVKKNSSVSKTDVDDKLDDILREINQQDHSFNLLRDEFTQTQNVMSLVRQEEKNMEKLLLQTLEELGQIEDEIWTSFSPSEKRGNYQLLLQILQKIKRFTDRPRSPNSKKMSNISFNRSQNNPSIENSDLKKKTRKIRESDVVQLKYIKEILSKGNNDSENDSARNSGFSNTSRHNSVKSMPIHNLKTVNNSFYEDNRQVLRIKEELEAMKAENDLLKDKVKMLSERKTNKSDNHDFKRNTTQTNGPNDLEYDMSENDSHAVESQRESIRQSIRDSINPSFYCEFEDENELKMFLEQLMKSNKERVEELELIIEQLKEKLESCQNQLEAQEIDNKKLKLENDAINSNRTNINKLQDQNRHLNIQDISECKDSEREALRLENHKLCTQIFKLTQENMELKKYGDKESNPVTPDRSFSGFMSQSDLLKSDQYQLDVSELNPNRDIARDILLKELQDRSEENQSELEALKALNSRLNIENESLKETVRRLHINHKDLLDQIEKLNKESGIDKQYLEDIKTLYSKLESPKQENKTQVESTEVVSCLNDLILKLQEEMVELKENNANMNEKIRMFNVERKRLLAELFKISNKLELKDKEIERKTYQLSLSFIQNALLKSEVERLSF